MSIKILVTSGILLAGIVLGSSSCHSAPLMVEKNLFSQDRKPPPPDTATASAPGKPGMPVTNIQLDGVVIHGNTRKALIRLKAQPGGGVGPKGQKKPQSPFVTVRENQQVGDYRVLKIEPKSVSLEKDGQKFLVSLFSEGKVVTPPAAPSQPPQVQQPGAGGTPRQAGIPPQGRGQRGQDQQVMQGQQALPVPGQAPYDRSMQQNDIEADPNMANVDVEGPEDEEAEQ